MRRGLVLSVPSPQPLDSIQPEAILRKGPPLIRVSEIYSSRQGEGLLTGTPSVFLRTSGCNLRCWFCDTRFASWEPEGEHHSLEEIAAKVVAFQLQHVVLTGGEPMIYRSLPELTQRLRAAGLHITIETAGTIYQPVDCDLMSISPKLSSSSPPASTGSWHQRHQARRERLDVVRQLLDYPYQLKFVVDSMQDAQEVLDHLQRLECEVSSDRVLLMPQGTDVVSLQRTEEWLLPWCKSQGFVYCPRSHILWYGNQRGT